MWKIRRRRRRTDEFSVVFAKAQTDPLSALTQSQKMFSASFPCMKEEEEEEEEEEEDT